MNRKNRSIGATIDGKGLALWSALAVVLFPALFFTQGIGRFDFWWWMSANIAIFLVMSIYLEPEYLALLRDDIRNRWVSKLVLGLISAAVLYAVFWLGNMVSPYIVPGAREGIAGVYNFKGSVSASRIFWSMILLIGPGEELIWRGFLQRHLCARLGDVKGIVYATLFYTGIHIFSGNVMLVGAALVCGLFWGFLYHRYRSMWVNIISHTVWDVAVFLLFPFN